MAKATKPRPETYEKKLAIGGIFEQVISASVKDADKETKKQPTKKAAKKK